MSGLMGASNAGTLNKDTGLAETEAYYGSSIISLLVLDATSGKEFEAF